jgi:hypothetical protein
MVREFNSSGSSLQTFGAAGTGNGQFNAPNGVTVDPNSFIWVADPTVSAYLWIILAI